MLSKEAKYYSIIGSSDITAEQLVELYKNKSPISYPQFYIGSDAKTLQEFCELYIAEAKAEGVKPEVAFCQAMLETGWLQFGGSVIINQFNFAGIGSVGPSISGAYFPNVQTGIRAQVQHLKAYANKEELTNSCVDPRFNLVERGTAPYVEWLGQKENPDGFGWATSAGYGNSILRIIKQI